MKAPCAQVAETGKPLVLQDMLGHRHFRDSSLAQVGIRFYAGVPLLTRGGCGLGALCVLGWEPRQVTGEEIVALQDLAAMVVAQIELQAAHNGHDAAPGVQNHSAALDETRRRHFKLLADMPAALAAADQLTLAFQPRIDTRSGDCAGAEALLRWRHPTLGNISPSEFMPIIEQTVLTRDVTDWVLCAAVAQAAAWRDAGIHLTLSINVWAANLEEKDFAARLRALAERFAVPPEAIELELTEGALPRIGGGAVEQMKAIGAAGFRFAIDDFGTGYSSVSHLEKIPVSVVKIDQSFMRGLGHDKRSETLAGAMVMLIHDLGYRAVAEGVETEQVYEILLGLGCDEVQGYLFGRPMPASALEELVARRPGVWRLAAAAAAA